MKYIEIEQKYPVTDPDTLRATLKDIGAEPGPAIRQVDAYYNAPHRDFLDTPVVSEWLRIRQSEDGSSFNYKKWLPDGAEIKTHCDEYETTVGDPEAVRRILLALGFTNMVTVDKTREEWAIPGGRVLIAIDTLEGTGCFVEFEFRGDAATIEDAITELGGFISDLDIELGERINRGYPHMLLGRDK